MVTAKKYAKSLHMEKNCAFCTHYPCCRFVSEMNIPTEMNECLYESEDMISDEDIVEQEENIFDRCTFEFYGVLAKYCDYYEEKKK